MNEQQLKTLHLERSKPKAQNIIDYLVYRELIVKDRVEDKTEFYVLKENDLPTTK